MHNSRRTEHAAQQLIVLPCLDGIDIVWPGKSIGYPLLQSATSLSTPCICSVSHRPCLTSFSLPFNGFTLSRHCSQTVLTLSLIPHWLKRVDFFSGSQVKAQFKNYLKSIATWKLIKCLSYLSNWAAADAGDTIFQLNRTCQFHSSLNWAASSELLA